MENRTVLITGATGYLGNAIKAQFLDSGWDVFTAGRSSTASVKMDFSNPSSIFNTPPIDQKIDLCVHLAASHEVVCSTDPLLAMTVNVLGTRALMEWCIKQGTTSFTYISTFHVFGTNVGSLTELVKPTPLSDYGLTHLLAEETVAMYGSKGDIEIKLIRPSNIIGAPADWSNFNRWTLAPFDFCLQANRCQHIALRSSGKQIRNWVELEAFSKKVVNLSTQKGPEVHHISGCNLSINDLAELVAQSWEKHFGKKVFITRLESDNKTKEAERNFYSIHGPETAVPDIDNFVLTVGSHIYKLRK
jgi:UDP-glucose 4-epimerase